MREIKFRGKDVVTGDWLYGSLNQRFLCSPSIIHNKTVKGENALFETPVHEKSVGQFIGLYDKNNKEVYEGDILRRDEYPYNSDGVDNYYAVVCWDEDSASFYTVKRKIRTSNVWGISAGIADEIEAGDMLFFEVVGNVYDNKDLLNL